MELLALHAVSASFSSLIEFILLFLRYGFRDYCITPCNCTCRWEQIGKNGSYRVRTYDLSLRSYPQRSALTTELRTRLGLAQFVADSFVGFWLS